MEDKRRDTGIPPAAAFDVATPSKQSDSPASGTPSSRRRGGGLKRKASLLSSGGGGSTPQSISSKRQAREKLLSVPFLPIHNGPCTRARQQPNNATTPAMSPNSAAAVKSEAEAVELREAAAGEAVKAADELKVAKEDWEALEAKIEAEFEAIKSRGDNAHVVPIHCGWFSWTKTHPLEEQTLPSFFNGKSEKRTPEIYMEIRNSIMKKFHTNPNTQIELQDLSELTVGELDARQEVMEFLDYWGLINYHPLLQADSADSGDVDNVEAKTDPLIEKLYRFGAELLPEPSVPKSNVARHAVPHGSFPESAIAEELAKSEGPSVEYHCNSCSADCSRKRYHCQKQADFDLCSECFNNGKFGSNMSPSDFILMEPGEAGGVSGGKWTDQENLLLLEALELYNENWNEIAEHVATKTRSQCILHFIQMSIEDTFVDREENTEPVSTNNESINPKDVTEPTTDSKDGVTENHDESMPSPMEIGESGGGNEEKVSEGSGEDFVVRALKDAFEATISFPSYEDKLSFAEAGNPVMALAAFLVRLVEPNVATASARCSLKSVSAANSSGAQLAARHCFLLEDPPDDTKPAGSDRAAIDTVEKEPEKNEKQNDENQKTTDSLSLPQTDNLSTDHSEGKNKDSTPEEKELSASPKSHDPKEEESVASRDEVKNESENRDLPKEDPSITEGLDEVTPKVECPPCSSNEPGDGGLPAGTSSTEVPKDDDEDMVSGSAPESKETNPRISSDLTAENEGKTGKEEAKCSNEKKDHVVVANEELKIDKVKHAAVTAISAAAVKAKLLANKEEEEIRQLATLLIEKQLHKLETKLTFFNEMEGVVMRVREHLERSKQKLYHERAQIIAARLGISSSSSAAAATPSSSRPTTQPSLPTTKAAMTFMNPALRPPSGMMVPQRPPLSRPPMTTTSSSPGSGPFAPPAAPGSSMQPMK